MSHQTTSTPVTGLEQLLAQGEKSARPQQAFLSGTHPLTWRDLIAQRGKMAALLQGQSPPAASVVLIASGDEIAVTVAVLACFERGLTAAVVDPGTPLGQLRQIIALVQPAIYIFDDRIAVHLPALAAVEPSLGADPPSTPCWRVLPRRANKGLLSRFRKRPQAPAADDLLAALASDTLPLPKDSPGYTSPTATALIMFTSGSTGTPKAVELSADALAAQLSIILKQCGYTSQTRMMNGLPLYHVDGIVYTLLAFAVGGTIYRPAPLNINKISEFLALFYREQITHFITVPTVLAFIDRYGTQQDVAAFQTPHFQWIRSSAGPLEENLWRRFEARFNVRVINTYGQTETVCEVIYCGPDNDSHRLGTIGKPVEVEVRLIDDAGQEVEEGTMGELYIKGRPMMSGYRGNEEQTRAVLQDGWFRTGDLATRDAEGFIRIVGRRKAMIIRGGINIFPDEVTQAFSSLADVVDAYALGLPDPLLGERLAACVVANPEANLAALRDQLKQTLAPEKLPDQIVFLPEIPRNEAGKIQRQEVLALLNGATLGQGVDGRATVATQLRQVVSAVTGLAAEELDFDRPLEQLPNWDSMLHVLVLERVEKHFGIRFSPREIMSIDTVMTLQRYVIQHLEVASLPSN